MSNDNINLSIVNFFEQNKDSAGIPYIKNKDWEILKEKYEKDEIRVALAEYISTNKIPFPIKKISEERLKKLFTKFCNTSMKNEYKDFDDVQERYDYKYTYDQKPLGVINKNHRFNDVSDFFQQENRMKCGSHRHHAPMDLWTDKSRLKTMNWHFWRNGVMEGDDLSDASFRTSFRLGTYTATQFKPSVAKALYEKHNAENILDTSCGWGDRLAGFYATRNAKLYVGCDPNPDVFEVYKKQCIAYEQFLTGKEPTLIEKENYFECVGTKTVKIWNLPSEDVDWTQYENLFDLYFTSPPYFETEKYATDTDKVENQSWSRYNSFDNWKYNFFFKVSEMVWPTIRKNGFMMINIIEPSGKRSVRHKLCDDMVDTFSGFDDCNYVGKIGMRMQARPDAEELSGVFIEPIWTFRKGNSNYEFNDVVTLDQFFV